MDIAISLRMILDIALAMALGGAIGLERELKDRPAGFRTHMLVAGAAALLACIGQLILADPRFNTSDEVTMDPLRMVEAVVAGVAFIGAGTIFAQRGEAAVVGITTAASLLMVAIIGVSVGFRYYVIAAGASVLTLLVLAVLQWMERRLSGNAPEDAKDDAGTQR
ncbi:MAG: MgtC/SapB family protein [Pseudomonadota bacterium]